ncbi:MAG: hypothetical protein ACR5LF_11965 [Symbiopectobacterium sp.]
MSETVTAFGAVQPAPYIPGNDDLVLELCALSREFRLNRGMFVRPGIFTAVNNVSLRVLLPSITSLYACGAAKPLG